MSKDLDARLRTSFATHPKTTKLIRRCGPGGAWGLVCLVLHAREYCSDGDLSGMTDEDIEIAAQWPADRAGELVRALVDIRFLDGSVCEYRLHDWADHQPWAVGSDDRSERATWAALVRRHGRAGAGQQRPDLAARYQQQAAGSDATSDTHATSSNSPASSTDIAGINESLCTANGSDAHNAGTELADDPLGSSTGPAGNGIAPSPSPSPSPRAKSSPAVAGVSAATADPCPHDAIIAAYHEILPELPQVLVWNAPRRDLLRARWREDRKRQTVDWWRGLFEFVRGCPFLLGQEHDSNRRPFFADLEWLVRPSNFARVIEGRYSRREVDA